MDFSDGPEGHHEQNPERQRLVQRLRALDLGLADIDRQIAAIPPPLAVDDRNTHVADLQRRIGR